MNCSSDDGGSSSDGDDSVTPDPVVASYSYVIEDYTVTFTNESVNADTYAWDFGDGETSTDKDPVHTYAEAGDYSVKMTASNEASEKESVKVVKIEEVGQDPMTLLTGGSSKTWILAPEKNAVSFGNPAGIWYDGLSLDDTAVEMWWGNLADQVEGRSCLFDNEYTFTSDGDYTRETNGAIWKEWKVFDAVSGEGCSADGEELLSRYADDDVSAWRDGDFTFELETWSGADTIFNYTLTTAGMGAYIGHYVSGTNTSDYAVHDGAEYGIVSIAEDRIELISYGWGGDDMDAAAPAVHDPAAGTRWYKVVLVPKP
ncbi:hypothetical protein BFP72_12895 [Reichenbachiella sp. 5M10]|nr:hypothetical protein BFP72_12895 [Reichenbachiella sp. 5M10]